MVTNYNDEYSLTDEEVNAIKIIINTLLPHAENLVSCDVDSIQDIYPTLYTAVMDLQEAWDSTDLSDSIEMWEEEINS